MHFQGVAWAAELASVEAPCQLTHLCRPLLLASTCYAGFDMDAKLRGMPCCAGLCHAVCAVPQRLEPLALPASELQRPVFAPYYRGGKRIHISMQVKPGWAGAVWGRLDECCGCLLSALGAHGTGLVILGCRAALGEKQRRQRPWSAGLCRGPKGPA